MARYQSTKTYGTDRGLSCCFRQWRANHSHCSTLHGYSLGFKFVWESDELDEKNWVFDFGGMKPIKQYLDSMFDHTVLVAEDDPALEFFKEMARYSTIPEHDGINDSIGYLEPRPHEEGRICALRIVPGVGCEMTARMVYQESARILEEMKAGNLGRYNIGASVHLVSVECFEHDANSAIYYGDTRWVHEVDVSGLDTDSTQAHLDTIRQAVKDRKTVSSSMVAPMVEALAAPAQEIGDLETFREQIDELHKVEPLTETVVTDKGIEVRDAKGILRAKLGLF